MSRKSMSQYLHACGEAKTNGDLLDYFTFNSFPDSGRRWGKTASTLITCWMFEETAEFRQARFISIFPA